MYAATAKKTTLERNWTTHSRRDREVGAPTGHTMLAVLESKMLALLGLQDSSFEDIRLLCEVVLLLGRQGFGRLRCFPQLPPSGVGIRLSICIAPLGRPSTHNFWEPVWWYNTSHGDQWRLPPLGSPQRTAERIAADRGPQSFVAQVIGSVHRRPIAGEAVSEDTGGFDTWLEGILARPERVVPVLLWDWYAPPRSIDTLPCIRGVELPFPPGFHTNTNEDWRDRFNEARA